MSLQRCSKIQRKEVKVGDDDIGASGVISYLLENIANDDILFEIFVRIPDCRSAFVCSSVSRRWHSLISQPRFVPRFVSHHQQHQDRYPPPCTIIFRKCEKTLPKDFSSALDYQPICMLFSKESRSLHRNSTALDCYLDFLPSPMIVRASCDDLLLLTPGHHYSIVFYVCNPITKQFFRLLDSPLPHLLHPMENYGFALARMPESECHFKVVLLHRPLHPHPPSTGLSTLQFLTIYCSKLGEWETKRVFYPRPKVFFFNPSVDFVLCNGILYWLEFERNYSERVLSFDLWGTRGCSVIDFPNDFSWFRSPDFVGEVDFVREGREQIGTVGGELRLIQVVLVGKLVYLKVWRLLDNSSSWGLVHDKRYSNRPKNRFVDTFVHPTDGDKIFMVWGKSVFEYNLMMEEEDTCEIIAEFQEPLKLNTGKLSTVDRLMLFPVVHPVWPTPLPSI